jgi:hypothetical protein
VIASHPRGQELLRAIRFFKPVGEGIAHPTQSYLPSLKLHSVRLDDRVSRKVSESQRRPKLLAATSAVVHL